MNAGNPPRAQPLLPTPPPLAGDSPARVDESVRDAEERLRIVQAAETRFRTLIDTVPVLVWVNGVQGCEYVNRTYLDFLGAEPSAVLGQEWLHFVYPDDLEHCGAAYARAWDQRAPFQDEVRLRRSDGVYRRMMSVAQPRLDVQDVLVGYAGAMFDITEFRDLEAALRRADRRKNEFIATLAHELRNPLTPIGNIAQLLTVPGVDAATLGWAHEVLERQLRNVYRLVEDLLDVSRIAQDKVQLNREPVDLAVLVLKIVDGMRPVLTTKHHAISVELPRGPVTLQADPLRLEQIFANLLHNATKFTPPDGHIWVTATVPPPGTEVVVRVRDDGAGIEPKGLEHIFDLFTQGDTSLEGARGGLGIGLTLVRRFVEMHGGTIEARSDGPGQGSELTVRLPTS